MTYDRNGNLNKNLHKNVSTITYNHLNLPTVITFTSGNTIEFLYDAAGTKLRKTVKVGATVQYVQDYLPGSIEYRQTGAGVKRVESVFHAEGRYYNTNVDASSTIAWRKEYNFKDHLGNTRLVLTDRNANGVVDITGTASTSDVLQENHYYSFGLAFEGAWLQNDAGARDNKYGYNSKELNDDFGLNWNDYGARWYDAGIGRWNAVDLLLEKMAAHSPFNYTFNNPIKHIDLFGMIPIGTPDAYTSLNDQFDKIDEEKERKEFWKNFASFAKNVEPQASLVVTNEAIGTALLVDEYFKPGSDGYNDYYYSTPTFLMTLVGFDQEGNSISGSYEVLRMGVKRGGSPDNAPYFQGFGAPNYPMEDITYTLGQFFESDTYTSGASRITGHYLLHAGPSSPTSLPPDNGGGRRNYGCIAVCGSRSSESSWQGLKSKLMQLNGATRFQDIPVTVISITIQPYQITGTPVPVSLNNKK